MELFDIFVAIVMLVCVGVLLYVGYRIGYAKAIKDIEYENNWFARATEKEMKFLEKYLNLK